MLAGRRVIFTLWIGVATFSVITASPLERKRRILNEPGDVPNHGDTHLSSVKRQQIIYLLNSKATNKRDKQPAELVSMETYAKELSLDGKVMKPNATSLLASEDFHGGGLKEVAVSKGDGPPSLTRTMQQNKSSLNVRSENKTSSRTKTEVRMHNTSSVDGTHPRLGYANNASSSKPRDEHPRTYITQNIKQPMGNAENKANEKMNEEQTSTLRVKDSYIRPVGQFSTYEVHPPSKPIDPNLFEIGEDQVQQTRGPGFYREGFGPHGEDRAVFPADDRPVRRWGDSTRWKHRHRYYHHRPREPVFDRRPNVYIMPMYPGRSNGQMPHFSPYQEMPPTSQTDQSGGSFQPGFGRQVVLQPLTLPMMPSAPQQGLSFVPSQPMLQNPYAQQPDARAALYPVPINTAPQQPQQMVYPFMTLPAVQQPQQQMQLVQQPSLLPEPLQQARQSPAVLANHWADETGHARSEVNDDEISKQRKYNNRNDDDDDDSRDEIDPRYDEDRYRDYEDNERRYHDEGYSTRDEREREAERARLSRERWESYYRNDDAEYRYGDRDENAIARSAPAPLPSTEENDDDDEEENEAEASERALQDSKDEPIPPNGSYDSPPEIEKEEDQYPPNMNFRPREREPHDDPSVIRIPFAPRPRMSLPFEYPTRFSADAFAREQLLGPSTPLRNTVLPRITDTTTRRTPIESRNGDISEMSASEARFQERMRMELQAKDSIPRGSHSSTDDGLKNVIIRLNGEPLENASELRSKIVHGRIIPGKGKVIKSKGPMRVRVTHRGKGRHRIKIIDIISPQKYSVTDSRSKIPKIGTVPLKRSQIHGQINITVISAASTKHGSRPDVISTSKVSLLQSQKDKDTTKGNNSALRSVKHSEHE